MHVTAQRAKVSLANVLVQSSQFRDNPNRAPRLDRDGVGKGAAGSVDAATVQSFDRAPLSSHWMHRTSLSFKPNRVLYLSKRHRRDLMYIAWYKSTISSVGFSIFGTVIGSPTVTEQERVKKVS